MILAIIGVGLIGGSLALNMRDKGMTTRILGVDSKSDNAQKAIELGLVDEIVGLDEAVDRADFIVISIPVSVTPTVAVRVLNRVDDKKVVMDMGSTKEELCDVISKHPSRGRFVATHPMWGTENSGPTAAIRNSFTGRTVVICQKERSDADALDFVQKLYIRLGMPISYMGAEEHDIHSAYVSHISHLTSFALALTVLEKELEEEHIMDLAGGGFDSTVRLAKSSPDMWLPIFLQNKYNVLDVLREHIHQLQILRKLIEKEDSEGLKKAMIKANAIRKIIK